MNRMIKRMMLFLCRTHNSLFLPENMCRLSETFSKAYDMIEVEKNVVLGEKNHTDSMVMHCTGLEILYQRLVTRGYNFPFEG